MSRGAVRVTPANVSGGSKESGLGRVQNVEIRRGSGGRSTFCTA
jgi:hypothetical protein